MSSELNRVYITVGKDNKPAELTLPPKLSFWITELGEVGDEQTKSRQLQPQFHHER